MKSRSIAILLFTFTCAFPQNGKVAMKNSETNSEGQTNFIYEPPPGLYMPEDVLVNVSCSDFSRKSIPLEKKGSIYEFSMELPPKSTVLFFAVSDSKQNTLDNNSDIGYLVYLKDPSSEGFEQTLLEGIDNSSKASRYLKLDINYRYQLDLYESLFESYPYMKNDSRCAGYYLLRFLFKKDISRAEMIDYAKKMVLKENDGSLSKAYFIYEILEMEDEKKEVAMLALEKYPKGFISKSMFIDEYHTMKEKTEAYVSYYITEYKKRFGDTFDNNLYELYGDVLSLCLEDKDTLNLAKYEDVIPDKLLIGREYDYYASRLSGEDLASPGTDLDFAEKISRRSLDIIRTGIEDAEADDDVYPLQETYHWCADTYALILYKQKKYDVAFQYQNEIIQDLRVGITMDEKERYAAYAEKAKGLGFAKDYIEKQLLAGTDSRIMAERLQEIYAKLNLPENELENIKKQYRELAAQQNREEIINKYGDIKAIDFTLLNLEDEKITLSDFKGKVVILDFWATWCGPCKSSFPKMQELVTKFEKDDVEFFFINSWERQEPDKTKEKVMQFLEEKGYSFNVLFDHKNEVIEKYKVTGIPEKILIDKSGNMKSIVRYTENLAVLIEENL